MPPREALLDDRVRIPEADELPAEDGVGDESLEEARLLPTVARARGEELLDALEELAVILVCACWGRKWIAREVARVEHGSGEEGEERPGRGLVDDDVSVN